MEKYAVELDTQKTKIASSLPNCPQCGTVISNAFPHCKTCGTEPFESGKWTSSKISQQAK